MTHTHTHTHTRSHDHTCLYTLTKCFIQLRCNSACLRASHSDHADTVPLHRGKRNAEISGRFIGNSHNGSRKNGVHFYTHSITTIQPAELLLQVLVALSESRNFLHVSRKVADHQSSSHKNLATGIFPSRILLLRNIRRDFKPLLQNKKELEMQCVRAIWSESAGKGRFFCARTGLEPYHRRHAL